MISRRHLIKGLAATSAAPLAMQLANRAMALEEGLAKPGVLFYFFPEGTLPDLFFPKPGAVTTLPQMSKPLLPWLSRLTFIDGLSFYTRGQIGYVHEAQEVALAAGAPTSIDNVIAQHIGAGSPFPVLRIGVGSNAWEAKGGNSRLDGIPQYCEDSPVVLYQKLFGQGPNGEDATLTGLRQSVGYEAAQQAALQLDALADIKAAINRLPVPPLNLRGRFTPESDFSRLHGYVNTPEWLAALVDIQQDITVMALSLGLSRCVNFMVGHEIWPPSVVQAGIFTELVGHTGGSLMVEQVVWFMTGYARLLAKLAALPAPGGTLLDNTFCLSYSNMGVAKLDYQTRIPYVLAGGQNFGHVGGRSLDYRLPQDTLRGLPHAQLYTAIAQKLGVNITRFGDESSLQPYGGGALKGLWDKV